MGKLDAESKRYVGNPRIFADAFNYLLYNGDHVINPDELRPVDTTEVIIPYGNGARVPMQRYRDVMKIWGAMQDGSAVYVLLGSEIQNKIHYAMPVKDMLYDAINYASQVDKKRTEYHRKDLNKETLDKKLTQEEFLSGFRKTDKLIPVVTAVIYFGTDAWDGPLSIHEMLDVKDQRILKAVPDYRINLISAAGTPDEDFDTKFSTGLGLTLHAIKYSRTNAVDVLSQTNHRLVDRESGEFIREALNIDLQFSEPKEKGEVDMCKAVADYTLKTKIQGAIEILQGDGNSEEEIVKKIVKKYNVTEKYVLDILHTAA